MCKKIIDKCCKIWVCAVAAPPRPLHHISISIYQRKSKCKLVVSLKNGTVLVKKKTAQTGRRLVLWTSGTKIIPPLSLLAWTPGQPWVRIKITRLQCQAAISTRDKIPDTTIQASDMMYLSLVTEKIPFIQVG